VWAPAAVTAARYVAYMRTHVFKPAGVMNADWRPIPGSAPALGYPRPPVGSGHGGGAYDGTLTCGGDWVLSPSEVFRVTLLLAGGDKLLDATQRQQMNTDCLGWDCFSPDPKRLAGQDRLRARHRRRCLWSFAGVFKGSVVVVLFVNSLMDDNITSVVANAFAASGAPGP
jgi:CubicO group peptidase (beta-lactamase class C family)